MGCGTSTPSLIGQCSKEPSSTHLVQLGLEAAQALLERRAHGRHVKHLVQVLLVRRLQLGAQAAAHQGAE
jgi:hypothetical protein